MTSRSFRFSLSDVPAPLRHETMREVVGRALMNMDFVPLTEKLSMEIEGLLLPGVTITDAWISGHRADTGYDLSRDSDDFALVWSSSPARGMMSQFGKDHPADGSGVLISCADRMTADTRETFHHVTVKMQRAALSPLLPDVEAMLTRPIAADNDALRLLASYIASFRSLDSPAPELDHVVATHIVDLVALAVGTNRDAAEQASRRGLRAARLDAVKRWVLARLASPGLGVAEAAAAVRLSPRSVQLLFEQDGTTFTAYVLRERLGLARHRLAAPGFAGGTISEIAYGCGFGDLSYFTRSFRGAYGETPSDARHKAMGGRV